MLKIYKGGILRKDGKKIKGSHLPYLMEPCKISSGVTLRDIFTLIKTNHIFIPAIVGNWCMELVNEGLTESREPADIDYLELYWRPVIEKLHKKAEIYGTIFPSFRGRKGKEARGISLTSPAEIIDKPVKIKKNGFLYEDDPDRPLYKPLAKVDKWETTLLQIYYAIIWELSFHGSPESRDNFKKKMGAAAERALKLLEETDE